MGSQTHRLHLPTILMEERKRRPRSKGQARVPQSLSFFARHGARSHVRALLCIRHMCSEVMVSCTNRRPGHSRCSPSAALHHPLSRHFEHRDPNREFCRSGIKVTRESVTSVRAPSLAPRFMLSLACLWAISVTNPYVLYAFCSVSIRPSAFRFKTYHGGWQRSSDRCWAAVGTVKTAAGPQDVEEPCRRAGSA